MFPACETDRMSVRVVDDEFASAVRIDGTVERRSPNGQLEAARLTWRLRSWVPRTGGASSTQLYVVHTYTSVDWNDWAQAGARGGVPLELVPIDRQLDCRRSRACVHTETVGVAVPTPLLKASTADGLKVKLYARNGEELVVGITDDQVRRQLQGLCQVQQRLGVPCE